MSRAVQAKRTHITQVEVITAKRIGAQILCNSCNYQGQADVILIKKRKCDTRGIERCPECKSLNILSVEEDPMEEEVTWQVDEWHGCYPSDWRKMLVPGAMAHPAKFSSRLIRNIYTHLFAEGWVFSGDKILDPFGGIALGAVNAMLMGLEWTGVELEPKFADLGQHNIANWNITLRDMPHWSGKGQLFQGDSRKLLEIVSGADAAVSSPPYKNATEGSGLNVNRPASFRGVLKDGSLSMGESDGNLGQMKDNNFDAAISSPPFRQSEGGTPEPKPGGVIDAALYARHAAGNSSADGYGETEGQLANMKERADFESVVSSPPFEDNLAVEYLNPAARKKYARENGISNAEFISPIDMEKIGQREQKDGRYGNTDGQLGADSGDDFWMAARQIVEQVYIALRAGGHATWVCKDFVRGGERIHFSDQWRQLCESVGFVTVHEHHALLTKSKGSSMTLEGGTVHHQTSSKSFFRRIAEKKGSPKIDWEVIWCMEKPK